MAYSYAIIKYNNPSLETERVLLENKYKKNKKYALIQKSVHKDGSESVCNIYYTNNLNELQEQANGYISWYNYPLNLCKNIQGYITLIN